jgi:hypothetical protein
MSCKVGTTRFTKKSQSNAYSCFSNESLVRIANTINKSLTDSSKPIPQDLIKKVSKDHTPSRKKLIHIIRKVFRPYCKQDLPHHEDSCIVQKMDIDLGKDSDAIPPPAPNNKLVENKPWSTSEVNAAMSYIEKKFPQFMFLEPAPMDFDTRDAKGQCLVSELCEFDIRDVLKHKKRCFGTLFNTHPSYRPGGHWICLFCCLYSGRICFYDSYGFLPEKEVVRFMKRIQSQYEEVFGKSMKMMYNDYQNQHKNVECGTFCIMFLNEMARHGNMEKAIRYIKDDDRVRELRTDIFTYNYNDHK